MLPVTVWQGYARQHNRHGGPFQGYLPGTNPVQRELQGEYMGPCIPGLVRFAGCLSTDKTKPVIRRAS